MNKKQLKSLPTVKQQVEHMFRLKEEVAELRRVIEDAAILADKLYETDLHGEQLWLGARLCQMLTKALEGKKEEK